MKFSKSWTTVTPLSKLLAMILFILLPFAGLFYGMHYQKTIDSYQTVLYQNSASKQAQKQQSDSVSVQKNNITTAIGGKQIYFYHQDPRLCLGTRVDDYQKIVDKQNADIANLEKTYEVVKVSCNTNGSLNP